VPKRASAIAAALCAAALTCAPAAPALAGGVEQATLREINTARASRDLGRLQYDDGLASAATDQSDWMAANDVLGHRAGLAGRLGAVAPDADLWGETVAWMPGSRTTLARRTVRAWLRSPPHRAILLMPAMRSVGVGEADGDDGVFLTADFAG
jgi:uncharacterized protein YkwD